MLRRMLITAGFLTALSVTFFSGYLIGCHQGWQAGYYWASGTALSRDWIIHQQADELDRLRSENERFDDAENFQIQAAATRSLP